MDLLNRKIVLGVTGGVAAYKAAELVRLMTKQGASVQVVMTEAATHFVGTATFQALSGLPVYSDQWDARVANGMAHIELTRGADLLLVAPASADFLGKVAQGRSDDLLSTLVLARDCPLAVVPAMNRQMWESPATQRNVSTLVGDGIVRWGPASGVQACGETGVGRMLEPEEILEDLVAYFQPKLLEGRRVLLTAGPTFEAIDAVRGVTNLSSGKMGFALARAAAEAGAEVTLVAGPSSLATPRHVVRIDVLSAMQMHEAVMARAGSVDVFIGVAAIADYRVEGAVKHKLKKEKGEVPKLIFVENPDILASVAALKKAPYCVGFAAESDHLDEYAARKRERKKVPLIVANLLADGFGGDFNQVVLFDEQGRHPLSADTKLNIARRLVAEISRRL